MLIRIYNITQVVNEVNKIINKIKVKFIKKFLIFKSKVRKI
ncbi:hypothetical protein rpr22_0264 [Rickettsia prowazekii str. Rp22]|uniref:Uncharacterized protein n=1 Tax=Rickettsia prowazekii (strain Rp22) TaxID=449216 RepID=D5AWH6_RICPP|nr:hypothetical protein rpr22_0264 [Rickettsia prowazekii str. Rp22]